MKTILLYDANERSLDQQFGPAWWSNFLNSFTPYEFDNAAAVLESFNATLKHDGSKRLLIFECDSDHMLFLLRYS